MEGGNATRDRQRGAAIRVKVVHGVLRKITTTDGATCGSNLGAVVCVFGGHGAKSIDNHQPEEDLIGGGSATAPGLQRALQTTTGKR